jgi:hypothetical protein
MPARLPRGPHSSTSPEYCLTDLGAETATKLLDLIEHLETRMPVVLAAQKGHDQRAVSD